MRWPGVGKTGTNPLRQASGVTNLCDLVAQTQGEPPCATGSRDFWMRRPGPDPSLPQMLERVLQQRPPAGGSAALDEVLVSGDNVFGEDRSAPANGIEVDVPAQRCWAVLFRLRLSARRSCLAQCEWR